MRTQAAILIVDDDPEFRKTLCDILRAKGYAPLAAAKGETALNRVEKKTSAVALIDLKLPDMDGLEVMREIKKRSPDTECIVLTGYASHESAIEAVRLGAYSYMQKPYDVEQLVVTIRRAIEKREAEEALRESEQEKAVILDSLSELVNYQDNELRIIWANRAAAESVGFSPDELVGRHCYEIWQHRSEPCIGCPVVAAVETGQPQKAEMITPDGKIWSIRGYPVQEENDSVIGAVEVRLDITERKRVEEALKSAALETLEALSRLVEATDPYTSGHSITVTEIAIKIAQEMGLMDGQLDTLRIAGPLHDVGKVGIPSSVLNKPTGLTEAEWVMIRAHPQVSANVAQQVTAFEAAVPVILHHHERWDGTGYPDGLKEEDIPLLARILAVADGFQAMISERPYRRARTDEEALAELEKGAGTQWDPQVVKVFLKLKRSPTKRTSKGKKERRN